MHIAFAFAITLQQRSLNRLFFMFRPPKRIDLMLMSNNNPRFQEQPKVKF